MIAPQLHPIQVQAPREKVGIDLIGLPESRDGYKYGLTVIDLFTKYVEFYPLKDKSALAVVRKLWTHILR